MDRRPDVVIVGAGPAGATAAILLAQAGARAVILDKARFPRDKLCGEFVSPEALGVLNRTGVLQGLASRAGRASQVLLTSPIARPVRLPIPAPAGSRAEALGIPRLDMDWALLERAASLGAEGVEGVEARRVVTSGP